MISELKSTNASTITSITSPREPATAYCQAFSISLSVFIVDCPFPDEDIKGFTTHGIPTSCTAFCNSSAELAYWYLAVFNPNSFAAKSRIALRFMVKLAAFAEGTTVIPCFS
ncbi:hypothetical protein D3C84_972480 [compost metagenome]